MIKNQDFELVLLRNSSDIIDNIDREEVEKYHYAKQNLLVSKVSHNIRFQDNFLRLYKCKRAWLGQRVLSRIFEVLEEVKFGEGLELEDISRQVFGTPPQKLWGKHFSLLTQVMHTAHEGFPIYDRDVSSLFEDTLPNNFDAPHPQESNVLVLGYTMVTKTYNSVLSKDKFHDLFNMLHLYFEPFKESLGQAKCLDLLVRSAGNLKRQGKLIGPEVHVFPQPNFV